MHFYHLNLSLWKIIILFIALSSVISVQSIALSIDQSQLYVKPGDTFNLSCMTDKNAQFLISNPIHWEKVCRDGSRLVIATLADVVESFKDRYSLTLPSTQQGLIFKLHIVNGAEFYDDGFFKCIMKNAGGSVIAEAQTEVIVLRNMDKITFTIDNTVIDQTYIRAEPIYLEEGDYEPTCSTVGSNPASVIKMYLNDMEIGSDETMILVDDKTRILPPRVFNTEKKALLKLTPNDTDRILTCVATVHDDTAMLQEVSFKLEVYSVCTSFSSKFYVNMNDTLALPCPVDNYSNAAWHGPCLNTAGCTIAKTTPYFDGLRRNKEVPTSITLQVANRKKGHAYDLRISPVSMNTLGIFSCFGLKCTVISKRDFEVILKVKPSNLVINKMINDKLVGIEGVQLDLVCTVTSGTPLENMTWYKDQSVVATGGPGIIRYWFMPAPEDNGQNFSCVVQSDALETPLKRNVKLDIKYRPVVECVDESISVVEGNIFTVQCLAHSNPPPTILKIFRHIWELKQCIQSPCSLKLNSSRNDSGVYMCTAQNQIGNGNICQAVVNILYPPVVSIVILNDTTLRCMVTSEPNNVTYLSWQHFNELGEVRHSNGSEMFELCSLCRLYMVNGLYICSATNGIRHTDGSNISFGNVSVQLKGTPEILPKTKSTQYGKYKKPVTLEIFVYSTTMITVERLFRNDIAIETQGRLATNAGFKNEHQVAYHIAVLQEVDFAQYTFEVKNDKGALQFTVNLVANDDEGKNSIQYFIWISLGSSIVGAMVSLCICRCKNVRNLSNTAPTNVNAETEAEYEEINESNLPEMADIQSVNQRHQDSTRSTNPEIEAETENENLNTASTNNSVATEVQYNETDDHNLLEIEEIRRQDTNRLTNPEIEAETKEANLNVTNEDNVVVENEDCVVQSDDNSNSDDSSDCPRNSYINVPQSAGNQYLSLVDNIDENSYDQLSAGNRLETHYHNLRI